MANVQISSTQNLTYNISNSSLMIIKRTDTKNFVF